MPPVLVSRWVGRRPPKPRPPRWARLAYASRRSGWALERSRRIRALREHQLAIWADDGERCRAYVVPMVGASC